MILPGSYLLTLILFFITFLCWGSWANSLRLAGQKWRFELFYYDFAIGVLGAAIIAAFTFGCLGLDGFTVLDDIQLAGKRQDAFAFAAGCLFNLGNLLIVAALSLSGLSVALPVGMGLALIVGGILGLLSHSGSNVTLVCAGCVALLAAVVFDGLAWTKYRAMKTAEAQAASAALAAEQTAQGKTAPQGKTAGQGRKKSSKRRATPEKALFLAALGGILAGSFYPLISMAGEGENSLGPYTTGLIFALGVAFSTFAYNLFFMNLPIHGTALDVRDYFSGKAKNHLAGILGGAVWSVGAFTSFVAEHAEGRAAVPPSLSTALLSSAPILAACWGWFMWKESSGADNNVKILLGAMLLLFVAGIASLSLATGGPR